MLIKIMQCLNKKNPQNIKFLHTITSSNTNLHIKKMCIYLIKYMHRLGKHSKNIYCKQKHFCHSVFPFMLIKGIIHITIY